MSKIPDIEIDLIIHELVGISQILKTVGEHIVSSGQKQILIGCETRLIEIRQKILQTIEEDT